MILEMRKIEPNVVMVIADEHRASFEVVVGDDRGRQAFAIKHTNNFDVAMRIGLAFAWGQRIRFRGEVHFV